MDPNAVEQAHIRFAKAERALRELKSATSYIESEIAWSDFLIAAGGIYSKLEQGAKGHPKSEPWFGRKKKERRSDPILKYLHYARNSDEHGIQRLAERKPSSTALGGNPIGYNQRVPLKIQKVEATNMKGVGPWIDAWVHGAHLELVRVKDTRYGDYCDPPVSTKEVDSRYPETLAEAALPLLKALVDDARRLL